MKATEDFISISWRGSKPKKHREQFKFPIVQTKYKREMKEKLENELQSEFKREENRVKKRRGQGSDFRKLYSLETRSI
jgi:hypothetical protein